jgi:DNA-binding Lrp family transcriptional regulator
MAYHPTESERAILAAVQGNLPDSAAPFADIAANLGTDEETVLTLLRRLKKDGVIRRFGASIKHQHAGWAHNSMVAWKSDPAQADLAGPKAAALPHVSHCYYRPSPAADWPYTLFTMVHGRSSAELSAAIEELRNITGLAEYAVLESIRELKKTSMTYF